MRVGRISGPALILGIAACVIVSLIVAYGLRIDYVLREQTDLSIAASAAIKTIESGRLAVPLSYDLRNRLIGPTVLEFHFRALERGDEDEIRAVIHGEIDQFREYLNPIELVIVFED